MSSIKFLTCLFNICMRVIFFTFWKFYLDNVRGYSQNAHMTSPARDHSNCIVWEGTAELFRPKHMFSCLLETRIALELYLWWLCFLGFCFSFLIVWFLFWGFNQLWYTSLCISNSWLDFSLQDQRRSSWTTRLSSVAQSGDTRCRWEPVGLCISDSESPWGDGNLFCQVRDERNLVC